MNKKCDGYIRPFRFQLLQSFPYIVEDFDQLTEYQLFCKLVEKVNEVIGNENEITKEVNTIKEYLDTLDLQDEVNNKLDEMAESGELQEIIGAYLNANALWCFDNVESMKDATNLINGSYAKTLGYYSKNDGGGATYKIRTITNEDVVDNMFIISINNSNNLVCELMHSGNVNIKSVGAYGDNTHNDTLVFQKASEKLYSLEGGKIIIPKGDYLIDSLALYPYVSLEGENIAKTRLIPSINANSRLIYMAVNPIRNITIENFSIVNSNDVDNLIAMDLTSIPSTVSPYSGGIWHTSFNNININNFLVGIKLEAIDNQGDEANQFLNFYKVCIYRKGTNDNERCIIINQQLGQTNFESCMFESTNQGRAQYNLAQGVNVDIGSTISLGDSDVACLLFNNCTFQNSIRNILLNAKGVTIRDSWFENIGQAIEMYNNANLNLYNNRFANAFYVGDGTGYVVKTAVQVYLKAYDNFITGARAEHFITGNKNARMINLRNNYVPLATTSSGIVRQASVSNENSLDARGENIVYVGASDTELKTITSWLSAGEELTIIVGGGVSNGQSLKITTGGNIYFVQNSPIILHTYDCITLVRQDILGGGANWWIKSVNKQRYSSASIPSSNTNFASTYFLKGDIIYNSTKAVGSPIGWECITSGTPGTWASIGNYE